MIAIVDAGPLYAAVDAGDPDHARCVAVLSRPGVRLVVPAMVVAEVAWLVSTRLGAQVEARFVRSLIQVDVTAPTTEDWPRIAWFVERYADLRLGATDASVLTLAERLGTTEIVTLDRRHFSVVRLRGDRPVDILP